MGAGCGSQVSGDHAAAAEPTTFDVKGQLTLMDAGVESTGDGCYRSSEGYGDIDTGAQVTVYDANGKALALGALVVGWGPPSSRRRWPDGGAG